VKKGHFRELNWKYPVRKFMKAPHESLTTVYGRQIGLFRGPYVTESNSYGLLSEVVLKIISMFNRYQLASLAETWVL
jgi:hypothetical protein